jgi:hypothetical protein
MEELIFIPALPYHLDFRFTERDNRYPPYSEEVDQSSRVAYITTRHPELDDLIRKGLDRRQITWKETQIGDYHIFFQLSAKIKPKELGIISW